MEQAQTFLELGVEPNLVSILDKQGILNPFEIQTESIPPALEGKDLCCRAPTGSGKTLAFGLPLIMKCPYAEPRHPTALILSPTRELTEQTAVVLKPLAKSVNLGVLSVYGGVSYSKHRRALDKGVDILAATPGRLIDLMKTNAVSLKDVGYVVIDEADRMADMGFIKDVKYIIDNCSKERQTLLYSATLDDEVGELVADYQNSPTTIEVGPKEVSMDSMQHHFWLTPSRKKALLSAQIINRVGRTVVFCRTRLGVDRVGDELEYEGISVQILHGGLTQRQRDRAMDKFIDGKCVALIATDVAARGIDVSGVQGIIHYDPADDGKAYKHRSGRTARAGAKGTVVSLVQHPQKRAYSRIISEVGLTGDFTDPDIFLIPENDVEYVPPTRKKARADDHYAEDSGNRNQRGGGSQQSRRRDSSGGRRRGDRGHRSHDRRNDGGYRSGGDRGHRSHDRRNDSNHQERRNDSHKRDEQSDRRGEQRNFDQKRSAWQEQSGRKGGSKKKWDKKPRGGARRHDGDGDGAQEQSTQYVPPKPSTYYREKRTHIQSRRDSSDSDGGGKSSHGRSKEVSQKLKKTLPWYLKKKGKGKPDSRKRRK